MTDTPKRIAPEEWEAYRFSPSTSPWATSLVQRRHADALIAKLVAAVEERDRMLDEVALMAANLGEELGGAADPSEFIGEAERRIRARASRDHEEEK